MNRLLFIIFLSFTLGASAQIFRPNQPLTPDESTLAIQYYQDGDYEKALVLLEKLYAIPNNEAYFDIYFNTLVKLKRYDAAEKAVRREIKKNPQSEIYHIA
ncbi:hypothetical protein D3C73_1264150 [compost metagenome]